MEDDDEQTIAHTPMAMQMSSATSDTTNQRIPSRNLVLSDWSFVFGAAGLATSSAFGTESSCAFERGRAPSGPFCGKAVYAAGSDDVVVVNG